MKGCGRWGVEVPPRLRSRISAAPTGHRRPNAFWPIARIRSAARLAKSKFPLLALKVPIAAPAQPHLDRLPAAYNPTTSTERLPPKRYRVRRTARPEVLSSHPYTGPN